MFYQDFEKYKKETAESIKNTVWYGDIAAECTPISDEGLGELTHNYQSTQIEFLNTGTIQAIQKIAAEGETKICALSFASYMNPGGGVVNGAVAQEEDICNNSNLYQILRAFTNTVYALHKKRSNKCLYHDDMLYVPDVVITNDIRADIISCAAPNAKAAFTKHEIETETSEAAMRVRIAAVLRVAASRASDGVLILGAFGCGVFGNSVHFVGRCFLDCLQGDFRHTFRRVVFACPDKNYVLLRNGMSHSGAEVLKI